ncbi:RNA polymerase sigma-70 factor [Fulvivirga sp. RKSG066]|uniref:RNA polymerase sigma factor n=1 Tax=Fulvivirga aurantia TaxID=2529383 RepID=UPI0012BBD83B|nr:RNA polymerase sigma-70 factor [Fulvivirga aurantia]MTI22933.1 RNA polymerase sigma-70 factor [Fulvivirga aurantia]
MELTTFKTIFDEYYHPIKNFLYYKLGDVALAEDIAQEVFMKAWEKRDQIVVDTVKSYLYTIANNLTINHFKSAKSNFEFELKEDNPVPSKSETPDYTMEKDEFALKLEKAIASLTESQRVVFLMNRIDDLTYKEIAKRLDISVKAVEKRMRNALEALRQLIDHKI